MEIIVLDLMKVQLPKSLEYKSEFYAKNKDMCNDKVRQRYFEI